MEEYIRSKLDPGEIKLLIELDLIMKGYYYHEFVMHDQYVKVKEQGVGYLPDILQFCFLGLPMYELITLIKNEPDFDAKIHFNNGSYVTFEEIKKALDMQVFYYHIRPKTLKSRCQELYNYLKDQLLYLTDFKYFLWNKIRY